jgi:D-amino peptidase
VTVKECVSRYAAVCLPPARTAELLTSAARECTALAGEATAHPVAHRMEVEFDASHLAQATAVIPTVDQIDVRRVGFDAPDMTEAMKAFKVVTAIAAGAAQGKYG